MRTAAPKQLDQPSTTGGAKVSLVSVRTATITPAATSGSRTGPGVLVRLRLDNTTRRALDTSFVLVNAANAAGSPGSLVDGSPTVPMASSVRAGGSAQGTYAFLLDDAGTGTLSVSVSVRAGQPVVLFRGRAR